MGSRLISCLMAMITCCHGFGQPGIYEGYQVLQVNIESKEEARFIRQLSVDDSMKLDVWHGAGKPGQAAVFMVPPETVNTVRQELTDNEIDFDVVHENVERAVEAERSRVTERRAQISSAAAFDYNTYHTLEEIMAEVDSMVGRCPTGHECNVYSIGKTFEGRDMKVLRIYKNEPGRTAHWYDSAIHAREWLAPATHLKIVNHVLTNYDNDADVREFLDQGDHYHLFIHNPDGYAYTWSTARLWRKNRFNNTINRPNGNPDECFGVDLNRNYMHRWGNGGSSYDPCAGQYRGARPASELETQNVQNEVLRIKSLQKIETFMNIHTWASEIYAPWGSCLDPGTEEVCEFTSEWEYGEVMKVLYAMEKAIEETHNTHDWIMGNSCDFGWPTTGMSMDFGRAYGGAIFSFLPELRGRDANGTQYAFQAPESEIEPSFQEMWNGLVAMYRAINDFNERQKGAPGPSPTPASTPSPRTCQPQTCGPVACPTQPCSTQCIKPYD